MSNKKKSKKMWIALSVVLILVIGTVIFINTPQFGRTPGKKRLERITKSSNYYDGKFQNIHDTPQLTSDKNIVGQMFSFLFGKKERLTPEENLPSVKTDLFAINKEEDVVVWFGHSSYYMQVDGKRMLVDPVFSKAASPISFFNKAFDGTNIYTADEIPDIDYLFISHDHWDHLDYPTIKALKPRIKKVVCGLGVGEHFERWGFLPEQIIEMDWNEEITLDAGFEAFCLPARHFSGRGLKPNQSLWVSYLLQTPGTKIYIGGDSGYDTHYAEIGERFENIDLAIIENGQYDEGWKYIHLLPAQFEQTGLDLKAKAVMPVHNSKFALGNHAWDTPMSDITKLHNTENFRLITPMIGEKVLLKDTTQVFSYWWEGIK